MNKIIISHYRDYITTIFSKILKLFTNTLNPKKTNSEKFHLEKFNQIIHQTKIQTENDIMKWILFVENHNQFRENYKQNPDWWKWWNKRQYQKTQDMSMTGDVISIDEYQERLKLLRTKLTNAIHDKISASVEFREEWPEYFFEKFGADIDQELLNPKDVQNTFIDFVKQKYDLSNSDIKRLCVYAEFDGYLKIRNFHSFYEDICRVKKTHTVKEIS